MLNINELTIGEMIQIQQFLSNGGNSKEVNSFWQLNQKYFIRTVTMHYVGKLVHVDKKDLILSDASWIADDGRFNNMLKEGAFNEVEPYVDDVLINRDTILDATVWRHALPTVQKPS